MKRTIELYGLELEVEYDYFLNEPRVYYGEGLVNEGAEAYYEINDVSCGGLDVSSHITDEVIIEAIVEQEINDAKSL